MSVHGLLRNKMLQHGVSYGAKMTRYYQPVDDRKIGGRIGDSPHGTGNCYYCGCRLYVRGTTGGMAHPDQISTSDHYIPYCLTADLDEPLDGDKRVRACQRCNSLKGDKPADIFEYFIRQSDMRQPTAMLRREFARFAYLLMAVGFKTAMLNAMDCPPLVQSEGSGVGRSG